MRKPLVVYVSGAPGSGKTTLAKKLSEELYIPYVSSDLIHSGVRRTIGERIDRKKSFHEVYIPHLLHLASAGVSYVVEQVLQKGISELSVIEPLKKVATVIYVHTMAEVAVDRQLARELARTDRGKVLNDDELRAMADYHKNNLWRTEQALDLDIPTIIVHTDDGYEPDLEHILDSIERFHYNSTIKES